MGKLSKKIFLVCLSMSALGLVGCGGNVALETGNQEVQTTQSQSGTETVVTPEDEQEIINQSIKPDYEKTIEEVQKTAGSILTYNGVINSFTTLGSKGTLELAVGELNSNDIKTMLFNINIDLLVYDATEGLLKSSSMLAPGKNVKLYALDNKQTSSITPSVIVLNSKEDLEFAVFRQTEKFETLIGNVSVLTDTYSLNEYYLDDSSEIISCLSGQPLSLEEIKEGDKLFLTVSEHTPVPEEIEANTEKEEELKVLKELKGKTIYVKSLGVYREPVAN